MEFLNHSRAGLWVVDVQEILFPLIDRSPEILKKISLAIRAARTLHLPIFVTEQYPKGLGPTVNEIRQSLLEEQIIYSKTSFSGYFETLLKTAVDEIDVDHWILVGIETHICVLQTAKDLLNAGKQVVVLSDCVSSRSPIEHRSALEELKALGIRLSTVETVIYEMVRDADSALFKSILPLIKAHAHV